jgi:hypothetical protein
MNNHEDVGRALREIFRADHREHGPFPMQQSLTPPGRQGGSDSHLACANNGDEREQKTVFVLGAGGELIPDPSGLGTAISAGAR